jgi:hypothetical protein
MHWALLACLWSALVLKISSAQTEYECSGIADGDGQQCWVHGTAYFGDLLATNLRAPALALTGVSPGAAVLLPANGMVVERSRCHVLFQQDFLKSLCFRCTCRLHTQQPHP